MTDSTNDTGAAGADSGATSADGEAPPVKQSSTDGVGDVDTGNVSQLPGHPDAQPREFGVPKPDETNSATAHEARDGSSQAYRDKVHEAAEHERSLGHGAEAPRFNPGATE